MLLAISLMVRVPGLGLVIEFIRTLPTEHLRAWLQHRHIVKEVEGLEDHTHLRPVGRGPALPGEDVLPVEGDLPAGGGLQKVDTPQQGGLARAGGPDDGGHIPPVHRKINVPENLMLAKGFGQVAHL